MKGSKNKIKQNRKKKKKHCKWSARGAENFALQLFFDEEGKLPSENQASLDAFGVEVLLSSFFFFLSFLFVQIPSMNFGKRCWQLSSGSCKPRCSDRELQLIIGAGTSGACFGGLQYRSFEEEEDKKKIKKSKKFDNFLKIILRLFLKYQFCWRVIYNKFFGSI